MWQNGLDHTYKYIKGCNIHLITLTDRLNCIYNFYLSVKVIRMWISWSYGKQICKKAVIWT